MSAMPESRIIVGDCRLPAGLPTPTWRDEAYGVALYLGDCLAVMSGFPDASVDSIVTDPPYGLSFMGKAWDHGVPGVDIWRECLRVLKPGGHLLAFGGTRTQHRLVVAIEDAGFDIRDMIAWVYGSGFPKSLDVSKAIDKGAGAERVRIENPKAKQQTQSIGTAAYGDYNGGATIEPAPATPDARKWSGWGTALKPALEPICMARKPFVGTVVANVLEHGTGAINVDGCRVGTSATDAKAMERCNTPGSGRHHAGGGLLGQSFERSRGSGNLDTTQGRWPANFIHDGSPEVVGLMPDVGKSGVATNHNRDPNVTSKSYSGGYRNLTVDVGHGDSGSAARFFYCAKASKADRDQGMEGFPLGPPPGSKRSNPAPGRESALGSPRRNAHPTVKPVDLMQYLCRLVTPPGGIVLDPFMGSGSTGKAARREGFGFIGIELEQESFDAAVSRVGREVVQEKGGPLFVEHEQATMFGADPVAD